MSQLVSRILLAVLMFPLAAVFYTIVVVLGEHWVRTYPYSYYSFDAYLFGMAGLLTWVLVAVYWCLLWKSGVKWNSDRRVFTVIAAVVALIVGCFVGVAIGSMVNVSSGFSVFVGGTLAIILWLIATVLIWRETAAERAARLAGSSASAVSCPNCGYNLTGLSESRCPECGSKFTLDELLASQPNAKSEID